MREIFLPRLTEEQKYRACKVLYETGGIEWATARASVSALPGVVFQSGVPSEISALTDALERAGLDPRVQDIAEREAGWTVNDHSLPHPSALYADHVEGGGSPVKSSAVRVARVLFGIGCVLLLMGLFQWTEEMAKAQETGPQLLQVYTRSAFYGIVLIGIVFGIYVATRAAD